MLKKEVKFEWSQQCEDSFQQIKEDILKEPYWQLPQFNKQFILTTDGSNLGVGACLSQRYSGGLRPVAYFSRSLRSYVANYCSFDIELLAIINAVEHFKSYLMGKSF